MYVRVEVISKVKDRYSLKEFQAINETYCNLENITIRQYVSFSPPYSRMFDNELLEWLE